jgi:hypothetical protein
MINFPEIQQMICIGEGILPQQLQDKSRKREIVFPRQLVIFFLKKYTKQSWSQIGKYYGKDHATAMYSVETINNFIDTNKKIAAKVSLYDLKIKLLNNFEVNIITDKICEIKELLKIKIDNEMIIDYNLIILYNKLIENKIINIPKT